MSESDFLRPAFVDLDRRLRGVGHDFVADGEYGVEAEAMGDLEVSVDLFSIESVLGGLDLDQGHPFLRASLSDDQVRRECRKRHLGFRDSPRCRL